jgi:hypothetical protein
MEKDRKILLSCDIHFTVEGDLGDRKISFIKQLLVRDLVSQIRSKNWGSKKWNPKSSLPVKGRQVDFVGYLHGLTIELLTEDEAISLLK